MPSGGSRQDAARPTGSGQPSTAPSEAQRALAGFERTLASGSQAPAGQQQREGGRLQNPQQQPQQQQPQHSGQQQPQEEEGGRQQQRLQQEEEEGGQPQAGQPPRGQQQGGRQLPPPPPSALLRQQQSGGRQPPPPPSSAPSRQPQSGGQQQELDGGRAGGPATHSRRMQLSAVEASFASQLRPTMQLQQPSLLQQAHLQLLARQLVQQRVRQLAVAAQLRQPSQVGHGSLPIASRCIFRYCCCIAAAAWSATSFRV